MSLFRVGREASSLSPRRSVLLPLLYECVDVAAAWAKKKGIAEELPGIRGIVDRLAALDE